MRVRWAFRSAALVASTMWRTSPLPLNNFEAKVWSSDCLVVGIGSLGAPSSKRSAAMAGEEEQVGDLELLDELLYDTIVDPGTREGRPAMGQMGPSSLVIWQNYNPHPKLQLPSEFVFIDNGMGEAGDAAEDGFSQASAVTAGLQEVLFPLDRKSVV